MKTMNLIYQLKSYQFYLWINNGNLLYSFDHAINNTEKYINLLKENKECIIKLLKYNEIFSEIAFKTTLFFKIPDDLNDRYISNIQKSIYLYSELDKEKYIYNIPAFVKLKNINVKILKQAIICLL
ncbi:MAG: hypothetical protein WCP46_04760, partial [Alphaproteobacteria bacterium]